MCFVETKLINTLLVVFGVLVGIITSWYVPIYVVVAAADRLQGNIPLNERPPTPPGGPSC